MILYDVSVPAYVLIVFPAALRLRSKQPMPNKANSFKPNSVTPKLRQADSLVSPFPVVGVAYDRDDKTTSSVSRLNATWSRQYMHDPPVYDYPSHLTDHRVRFSSVLLTIGDYYVSLYFIGDFSEIYFLKSIQSVAQRDLKWSV